MGRNGDIRRFFPLLAPLRPEVHGGLLHGRFHYHGGACGPFWAASSQGCCMAVHGEAAWVRSSFPLTSRAVGALGLLWIAPCLAFALVLRLCRASEEDRKNLPCDKDKETSSWCVVQPFVFVGACLQRLGPGGSRESSRLISSNIQSIASRCGL